MPLPLLAQKSKCPPVKKPRSPAYPPSMDQRKASEKRLRDALSLNERKALDTLYARVQQRRRTLHAAGDPLGDTLTSIGLILLMKDMDTLVRNGYE